MSDQNLILHKLDEFIRKFYKNQLIKGLIYSFGLLLVFYLSASSIEYFGEFNTTVRTVLFYSFILFSGYVLSKFIVIPLLKLNKMGKIISHEEAADIVGKHFGNVQDKLLNVLQLQQNKASVHSDALLNASINQRISELKPVPFTSAIDLSENKKHLKYAVIPLLLLVSILVIAPKILSLGTKRLINHSTYFEAEAPFTFEIQNKNLEAIQQQDYVLKVNVKGDEVPDEVFVKIDNNEFKLKKENLSSFEYTFKNVQETFSFNLSGAGYSSKPYELKVMPKPSLADFDIQLKYPPYLNRKDETIANTGDFIVPEGTRIVWNFKTKNSEFIRLSFSDTTMSLKPIAENKFTYGRRLFNSSNYIITTGNNFVSGLDSVNYTINVIQDAYPTIELKERKDSVNPNNIYFSGNIKDDYGFNQLLFHYNIYSKDSADRTTEIKKNANLGVQKSITSQSFVHGINLSALELKPGDKVDYYFEVWDNDGVNGSKSAKSSLMTFKAPTLEELENQTTEKNKDIKKDLDQSIKDAKDLQKQITELNKNVLEKKQLGWEEKKKIESLVEKQKELQQKIDNIKQENQLNKEQQNQYEQPNESILEKQQQLEQLFENIMTPEMKKMFEELQKLMEKMDKNKVQETLEKMNMSNKDIEKELDRTLEQFKEMEAQQKMDDITNKLDDLAKKQEELSKQSEDKNADTKKLEEKQNELNKMFEQVKEDTKQLNELNKELENPMAIPDMKEEAENVDKEQQNAKEQLQKENKKGASKSQKNAAQQMKSMSEKMSAASQSAEQEQNEEDMQTLRQVMENLMNVSFAQEELVSQTQKTKTNNPLYTKLAQKQKKLQDESKMIEDTLLALSKRNPSVSASINREITNIQMNMKKAVAALAERQTGEATVREQNSMTSINNLALLLNESLEQMQAQAKAQKNAKPGSGSCKKPGGKGSKPSMSNMRQMQQSLNKQLEEMKKMLEQQGKNPNGKKPGDKDGKNPGGKSGNGGMMPGGNSEQFAKMAAEQEAIRRAMQEAMKSMQKNGKNPGGDLADKMEQTETELVNKVITQETIKRQQEIMTKLLEHEKAEREKELDEKRQSNEAKNQNFGNPNLFLEYNRLKEQEMELLKTVPASLNPYYKNKVSTYFNSFTK